MITFKQQVLHGEKKAISSEHLLFLCLTPVFEIGGV